MKVQGRRGDPRIFQEAVEENLPRCYTPPEMDPKPRLNHRVYLQALRRMSPELRLARAFELSENARLLFRQGLRKRFPDLSEEQIQELYIQRLALCHNRNY